MFCYINSETRYSVFINFSNIFKFTFINYFICCIINIINNTDRKMITNITYTYIIMNRIQLTLQNILSMSELRVSLYRVSLVIIGLQPIL